MFFERAAISIPLGALLVGMLIFALKMLQARAEWAFHLLLILMVMISGFIATYRVIELCEYLVR